MIIGIGIDMVEIQRFAQWHSYSSAQLQRILSSSEIAYCLQQPHLSAQRFAVRFATREAFFKAWNSAFPDRYIPFLTCCRSLTLTKNSHNAPQLEINWTILGLNRPLFTPLISLSHTLSLATACIVFSNISK
jgi:phosphopantetheine--protein transferase-like protein